MSSPSQLRIFVAMPGTDMGSHATYKNPESVKENLLKPVVEKLKARLGREVKLVIEKDKREVGVIHESMFKEARDADVYIADLTGANPNVYLELGVRWALRDRVTVPISQSVEDLKFNVFANRAILYYPDIIIKAIDDIVEAIEVGLKNTKSDSPVRQPGEFVAVSKLELDSLHNEIKRLNEARGEDLLRAAKAAEKLSDRVSMLKRAVDTNPASVEAMLELGRAYRDGSQYDEAVNILLASRRLDPTNATVHRELGVTYSKQKNAAAAVDSLRESVHLAPQDAEAWSNLGGALRRMGMAQAPDSYDRRALEEARDSYNEAHKIHRFDLYSGLNVARLNLLLSKWSPVMSDEAEEGFRKQIHLCRHTVEEEPNDYWRLFDLADALLFSGEYEESEIVFRKAVELVPMDKRKDKLLSVLGPLRDYLTADVLKAPRRAQVEETVKRLESAQPND